MSVVLAAPPSGNNPLLTVVHFALSRSRTVLAFRGEPTVDADLLVMPPAIAGLFGRPVATVGFAPHVF